ncbi:MAG TPA: UxaA family hydrolase, partial [Terriglobales bacterium]|nr:UxaA family hydrolase [Terriglobales bacterium]
MPNSVLRLHPKDNVLVALLDLKKDQQVELSTQSYVLVTDVPAKHKFATEDLPLGAEIIMYGGLVGKAQSPIRKGEVLTTRNMRHEASAFHQKTNGFHWTPPDVSSWRQKTFLGYHRSDGQVGTRNYWLVVPLVFCENRNIAVLKQAFTEELGLAPSTGYRRQVADLINLYKEGRQDEIKNYSFSSNEPPLSRPHVFDNVDGIKFLMHEGGCGGTRQDSTALCGLIAGYIHHPNVAGATILSLGCQNAQVAVLREELHKRDPNSTKPLLVFEQQRSGLESKMLSDAVRETFLGLIEINKTKRQPAPLSKLCIGLKCGGSDGFSGISANPAIGHTADLLAALGGRTILSEFPELCGAEQDLINRCTEPQMADRFMQLMRDYAARAKA